MGTTSILWKFLGPILRNLFFSYCPKLKESPSNSYRPMPSASSASSGILFGHQSFPFYFFARSFSEFSYQIAAVLEERGYNFVVESLYTCRTTRVQFFRESKTSRQT